MMTPKAINWQAILGLERLLPMLKAEYDADRALIAAEEQAAIEQALDATTPIGKYMDRDRAAVRRELRLHIRTMRCFRPDRQKIAYGLLRERAYTEMMEELLDDRLHRRKA